MWNIACSRPGPVVLASAVLLLGLCGGCGKAEQNQDAGGAVLLSEDDINLYLEVMRAASARVNNPTPADKATLSRMNRLQTDIEAGRIPVPSEGDREAQIIERGLKIQSAMDEIIAEDRQMDVAGYAALRDLIEGIVYSTGAIPGESDLEGRSPTPAEGQALLANKRVLAPYVPQIEQLYRIVRIPK